MFLEHPEIRYIWNFAEDSKSEDEMRSNVRLKYHGKRVIETIGIFVKSLNNLEVLDILLLELGARHVKYGAKPVFFEVIYLCNYI